jgi:hypothetical protein
LPNEYEACALEFAVITGYCSQYIHSGRLRIARATAAIHHDRARTPIVAKIASDGLIKTSTPGQHQRTAPATKAAIHMSVLPKRIWAGPFGRARIRSNTGHAQIAGRHHQMT